jgi:ADP-ribose pyrophosphatase
MNITRPESKQYMPPHAKRVFKGKIFDTYQWEQEGYDGKVYIFEKVKRADTVVILPITKDGRVLMTQQEQPGKKPFTALAGGRVDEGEDVFEAAKRELLEETGYISESWELFESLQPISKVEWAVYYFVARQCVKVADQNLDGGEKVHVKPVAFEEFVEMALEPDFYEEELRVRLLEAKLNPRKMQEFRNKVLGEK